MKPKQQEYVFSGWRGNFGKFIDDEINAIIYSYLSRKYNFWQIQCVFRIALDIVAYYLNLSHPELRTENHYEPLIKDKIEQWNLISGDPIDDTSDFFNDIQIVAYLYYRVLPSERLDSYHWVFRKQQDYDFQNSIDDELIEIFDCELTVAEFDVFFTLENRSDQERDCQILKSIITQNTYDDLVSILTLEKVPVEDLQRYYRHLYGIYKTLVEEYENLQADKRECLSKISALNIENDKLKKDNEQAKSETNLRKTKNVLSVYKYEKLMAENSELRAKVDEYSQRCKSQEYCKDEETASCSLTTRKCVALAKEFGAASKKMTQVEVNALFACLTGKEPSSFHNHWSDIGDVQKKAEAWAKEQRDKVLTKKK